MKNIVLFLFALLLYSCSDSPKQESKTIHTKVEKRIAFCYLSNIYQSESKTLVAIDFIEYKKTSNLDSNITNSQIIELPNGFCYLNEEHKLEVFPIIKNAIIVMQTFSFNNEGSFNFNQSIKLSELLQRIATSKNNQFKFSPFKVVLENNSIISLAEIYIP